MEIAGRRWVGEIERVPLGALGNDGRREINGEEKDERKKKWRNLTEHSQKKK